MTTCRQVKNLTWYIQGHSFSKDMIVLDMLPYDAILGYDWLKQYSPMTCDWQAKSLQFQHQGSNIFLKGIPSPIQDITPMSAKQVYKSSKGNDIWAFVVLATTHVTQDQVKQSSIVLDSLQLLLTQYANVF